MNLNLKLSLLFSSSSSSWFLGVTANSLHPGIVMTEVMRHYNWIVRLIFNMVGIFFFKVKFKLLQLVTLSHITVDYTRSQRSKIYIASDAVCLCSYFFSLVCWRRCCQYNILCSGGGDQRDLWKIFWQRLLPCPPSSSGSRPSRWSQSIWVLWEADS